MKLWNTRPKWRRFIRKGMMWPLFYTAVFYLAVNGLLTLLLGWFEKKLSYFKMPSTCPASYCPRGMDWMPPR